MIEKRNCVDIVKQANEDWKSSQIKAQKLGAKLKHSSSLSLINLDSNEVMSEFDARKRCDYLFLSCVSDKDICRVAPIEVKSKNPSLSYVKEQLQSGADFAAKKLVNCNDKFKLTPILVAKSLKKAERFKLKRNKISMHGQNSVIDLRIHNNIKYFWKQLIIKE